MYVTFSDEQPGAATIFPGLLNPGLSMHVTVGHDVDSDFDFDFDFDLDRDVPPDSRIHTFTHSRIHTFTIHHSHIHHSTVLPFSARVAERIMGVTFGHDVAQQPPHVWGCAGFGRPVRKADRSDNVVEAHYIFYTFFRQHT